MTTSAQTHPSLEELAAFLDGKLEGEERARVIQHLDECPDCYETFAGTARFLQEEENLGKQTQGGRVVPFPLGGGARTSWLRWLPVAAGVILVAGLAGTGYVSLFAPPRMEAEELVGQLAGKGTIYPWEVNRGGEEEHSDQSVASFLVGAWFVDQQVAIGMKDANSAREMSRRMWLALDDQRMAEEAKPFQDEAGKTFKTQAHKDAFLEELQKAAREREESLEKDNTLLQLDYLALGKWAEAARIAAATRNARFFESRDNRRLPSYFLKKHGEDFDPKDDQLSEIHKDLERAAKILGNNNLDATGFKKLEASLDDVIQRYGSLVKAEEGMGAEEGAVDSGLQDPVTGHTFPGDPRTFRGAPST